MTLSRAALFCSCSFFCRSFRSRWPWSWASYIFPNLSLLILLVLQSSHSSESLWSTCWRCTCSWWTWTASAPDLIASWDDSVVVIDAIPVNENWQLSPISSLGQQVDFRWNLRFWDTVPMYRVNDLHYWSFTTHCTCSISSSSITPGEHLSSCLTLSPNILLEVFISLERFLAIFENIL